MSASSKPEPQPPGDPSMEDILASIRRILSEEEQPAGAKPAEGEPVLTEPPDDDVLVLEPSMMIAEPRATAAAPASPAISEPVSDIITVEPPDTDTAIVAADPAGGADLVAPETARAAAASVSELVATLAGERSTRVYGGGPTIEDLVRAELRPVLKEWLDTHLPSLVERLVRTEIERVVGRIAQ
jgi:uncharacterized protein